jgi:APA family basic amino acid/polyamine antiporter
MNDAHGGERSLVRELGTWDCALLTIGNMVGSAIFLAASIVPAALPHPALMIGVWVLGGFLTLAGVVTYAELGTMFPKSGGPYQYLREAYGSLWGFLYGWTFFLVIGCGVIALLAVASADLIGAFFPYFLSSHEVLAIPLAGFVWRVSGGQVGAVLLIVGLTAINYVGLRYGVVVQNITSVAKIGALLVLLVLGFAAPAAVSPDWSAPFPAVGLVSGLGVAMVGVFWAYDGWAGVTCCAGEVADPGRNLTRGMLAGTAVTFALYVLTNLLYLRALPPNSLGESAAIGQAVAGVLLGTVGAPLIIVGVLVSVLGCLAANILQNARVYLPMAQDGVFFAALARIHPTYRTPGSCLVAQALWSTVLAFSGTYEQLGTYVIFAVFLFHAATGAALFVLRRTRPRLSRPYLTWGYPWVPAVFVLTSLLFVASTLAERPRESAWGLCLVVLGVPAYAWWRKQPHGAPELVG